MNKYIEYCEKISKVISVINLNHREWLKYIENAKTLDELPKDVYEFVINNQNVDIDAEIQKKFDNIVKSKENKKDK